MDHPDKPGDDNGGGSWITRTSRVMTARVTG